MAVFATKGNPDNFYLATKNISLDTHHLPPEQQKRWTSTTVHVQVTHGKHVGIQCDGCGISEWSNGARYKCISCESFDFCEACEDTFVKRYSHFNGTHLFIKMR